jgi:hypothetical protein
LFRDASQVAATASLIINEIQTATLPIFAVQQSNDLKILLSHPELSPADLGAPHQFYRRPGFRDSNWQKLGAIPQTMKRGFAQAIELALGGF